MKIIFAAYSYEEVSTQTAALTIRGHNVTTSPSLHETFTRTIQTRPNILLIDPAKDKSLNTPCKYGLSQEIKKVSANTRIIAYGSTISETDKQQEQYDATFQRHDKDEDELVKLIEELK